MYIYIYKIKIGKWREGGREGKYIWDQLVRKFLNFYFWGGWVQALIRPIGEMFLVKKKVNAIFFYRGGIFGRKTDYWV